MNDEATDGMRDWLKALGLAKYAELFAEHEIDASILSAISEQDLKDMGLPIGPRRKILVAIGDSAAETQSEAEPAPARRPEAERRQLTVMFCDLVGSTALSSRLDPEDMSALIRAFQNAVAGEIARFDGHIAKFMGDGVLAYFGWPRAHEDEAERAVRAGLGVATAVPLIADIGGERLSARVAVATGRVVVGDLIGDGSAREQVVVGETPNLAARLQTLAEPGEVVIAQSTEQLVHGLFDVKALAPTTLKGLADPVIAFVVAAERPAESRFSARAAQGLLPIIGRDQELSLLLDRWNKARLGEGQCVLLAGEAGIGKSRIIRALEDSLAGEPHTAIRYQCSPYHSDSALWPVIRNLRTAADIATDDAEGIGKLTAYLRQTGVLAAEDIALIARMIGFEDGAGQASPALPSAQLRSRTLAALVRHVLARAGAQPLALMLEDLHWIDPTTRELIERILDQITDARLLLVMTTRPEARADFDDHPHVTQLALNRLGRRAVSDIIDRLTEGKELPRPVFAEILAKTDGVPLYVEELTKAILESSLLAPRDDGYALTGALADLAIPSSLHDSLMARLDRDPSVKDVAQTAACIGRDFSRRLLAEVSSQPVAELDHALAQLEATRLVFPRGDGSDRAYQFKHALVQDAAYQSLLRDNRRRIHGAIADAMLRQSPTIIDTAPELLARHLSAADRHGEALTHWTGSGHCAAGQGAYVEAVRHLGEAQVALGCLPPSKARDAQELDLCIAKGAPLIASEGYASDRAWQNYQQARVLCERLDDGERLFTVLRGLWNIALDRAEMAKAMELARDLDQRADAGGDPMERAYAMRALCTTNVIMGNLDEGIAQAERSKALQPRLAITLDLETHGEDPFVIAAVYQGMALTIRGDIDQGTALLEETIAAARETRHPMTLAFALCIAAISHVWISDLEETARLSAEAIAVSEAHDIVAWEAHASVSNGWAAAMAGRAAEGMAKAAHGLRLWNRTGARMTFLTGISGEVFRLGGDLDGAEHYLKPLVEQLGSLEDAFHNAPNLASYGRLQQDQGADPETVIATFHKALDFAQAHHAKLHELRIACDLAALYRTKGQADKARTLLEEIYGRFSEGLDSSVPTRARALLQDLA